MLAVVGLPSLHETLSVSGVAMVGGGSWPDTGADIRSAIDAGHDVHLVLADRAEPGLALAVARFESNLAGFVLLRVDDGDDLEFARAAVVDAPATIVEVLDRVGMGSAVSGEVAGLKIGADGSVENAGSVTGVAAEGASSEDLAGADLAGDDEDLVPFDDEDFEMPASVDDFDGLEEIDDLDTTDDTSDDAETVPDITEEPSFDVEDELVNEASTNTTNLDAAGEDDDPWGDNGQPPQEHLSAEAFAEVRAETGAHLTGEDDDPWGDGDGDETPVGIEASTPQDVTETIDDDIDDAFDDDPEIAFDVDLSGDTEPLPEPAPTIELTVEPEPAPAPPILPPAPPGPPVAAQPEPAAAHETPDEHFDPTSFFTHTGTDTANHPHRRAKTGKADILFSVAAKGGTGKSTMAIHIAQRAAEAGLTVTLIDANRGQGDIVTYLRIEDTAPTIYDAAVTGDPGRAIMTAEEVNSHRHNRLQPLGFQLVLAPRTDAQADPEIVSTSLYRQVLEEAAAQSDLVVLDTQIVERHDNTGLIDGLVLPLINDNAWCFATTDTSTASVDNIYKRLKIWGETGINLDRVMLLVNRADPTLKFDPLQLTRGFAGKAHMLGVLTTDAELGAALNIGKVDTSNPSLRGFLDQVLHRVTSHPSFEPADEDTGQGVLSKVTSMFRRGR